ncbi:MAG: hypothetical protein HEQ16_03915 [Bosea sp.]|nr:hypothetical protein [Bosea sp. (in: a-proteobacteria)]
MGGITDKHVEWAIVNRLKAMLDEPPQTSFNVTQTFALFSSVLLWSKNRAWVAGRQPVLGPDADEDDNRAHKARKALGRALITAEPWRLSTIDPQIAVLGGEPEQVPRGARINSDFENMSAEAFFEWLRNAVAHGDARTIRPIHKVSRRTGMPLLAGFRFRFEERYGSARKLELALYHDDMRRLGSELADLFCQSLSGGNRYFEDEAGTARLQEAASAA